MIHSAPRILAAGDAALLVEFGTDISPAVYERVRALDAALGQAAFPGIVETVPAYATLLVEYDPHVIDHVDLMRRLVAMAGQGSFAPVPPSPVKLVPTVYGGEYGPDLERVAALHHLTPDQVVAIHSGTVYTVYMLGFTPGFAYMGSVPDAIATPRLDSPRTRVPAGSVAIAARQTGVYPQATPGGWQLLGRTSLVPFDPSREPACYFQPGDRVRFEPIPEMQTAPIPAVADAESRGNREVTVVSPGLLTTVQDLGRFGYQRFGIPISGVTDAFALRTANALVGNPPDAPGLEATVAGPSLQFTTDALFAVAGGDLEPRLYTADLDGWRVPLWTAVFARAGSLLEFGARKTGCRCYIAFAGGVSVPLFMGSASTYLSASLGGHRGRALQAGDTLSIGPSHVHFPSWAGRSVPIEKQPRYNDNPTVRIIMGPHADHFTAEACHRLVTEEYAVSTTSDRMGLRLKGPPLTHCGASEIVSCGIPLGAIQVPPDAQPIILATDRQTAGGYPIIATVLSCDMQMLAQCMPGSGRVRFEAVTLDEARDIRRVTTRCWAPGEPDPEVISF